MIQEKDQSISDSKVPCYIHRQSVTFDLPFHNLSHGKHNKHVSNPLSNNRNRVKFYQTFWNIVEVPKWKWIDPRNFQAWTWEELLIHAQVSYKTKIVIWNFWNDLFRKFSIQALTSTLVLSTFFLYTLAFPSRTIEGGK